ncbi:MAG: tetratricopeptide repeat protein [Bacteroidia bacterium]|nr:tetratricopeptide repeat protein [Bacteroidia bacterium]
MKISKIKTLLFLLFLLVIKPEVFSQTSTVLDSLKVLIRNTKIDTVKVNLYNKCFKFISIEDTLAAEKNYLISFKLSRSIRYTLGMADAMAGYADYLVSCYKNDKAVVYNKKAIPIYIWKLHSSASDQQATDIYNKIAKCYSNNGFAYINAGDYKKAISQFNNSLNNYEIVNNDNGISLCYNNLSICYKYIGDYTVAIDYSQKTYSVAKQNNDKNLMAGSAFNIASIYEKLNNNTKALKYVQLSLRIAEGIKFDKGIAKCYNSIGTLHYKQKNYKTALSYFIKSLKLKQKTNDKIGIAHTFNNIGLIYMSTKEDVSAIDNFEKALQGYTEIDNVQGQAFCLNNIALVYKDRGNYNKALDYLHKSVATANIINDIPNVGSYLVNIADILNLMGNYNEAIEYSKKSLEINLKLNYTERINQAYAALSLSYEKLNDFNKSLEYFKLYSQTNDSLFSKEKNKQMIELEATYQLDNKQKEIENLNRDKQIKDAEIKRQTAQKLTFLLGLLLMIIITIGILKRYYDKRKANQILTLQKIEISEKNSELFTQNEEILLQKTKLEDNLVYTEKLQEVLKADLSKYKQVALKKLINPHFIFNSLNSIQSFILQNDKLQASIYLSKFSDLMRKTLEYSQKDYISLNEELEALKLYLELEQKRFDGKFDFEIITDSKIDKNECKIPPMIFQPFVENSIWHGFMHKESNGMLLINLKLDDSGIMVICNIEDNGIGREKSKEINKNRIKRESHGIEITNQRLSILNSLYNLDIQIIYFDLKDKEGNSSGTKVTFNFPYIVNNFDIT